ncbi:MAG TPA: glycosyltransferase family 4 protein [Acidobacteriaceae bacterium]
MTSPQPLKKKLKIFIIHPSDWLTDHLSIGDGLVAHGFLWELAARGHDIHIATRMSELHKPFPSNVTLYKLPQSTSARPFDRLEYMLRVRLLYHRLARQGPFDVAHQMNPVFAGLSLAMAGARVPIVLGTYVPDWPDDPEGVISGKGLVRKLAQFAKNTICLFQQSLAAAFLLTSPAARPRIVLGKSADRKIHYLEHGIHADLFSPAADPDPTLPHTHKLLFLSNLRAKKGIYVLLEAFAEVLSLVGDCTLTIAGGGDEYDRVAAWIDAQPWRDRVTMHGRITREQSVAFYRSHHVYTLPSFGEPYATTVIEAMSCGLPVVTTNAGGVPFLILPGGGLAVPPRDPHALATALAQLLLDRDLAHQMGERNRDRILAHNTWQAIVDKLEIIYEQVSRSHGSRQLHPARSLPELT